MSLELGKPSITELTGNVEIYVQTGNGRQKKIGTLKVTSAVLPADEYQALADSEEDKEVARQLVKNIEAGDSQTKVATYSPEMMDQIFRAQEQFVPILDFCIAANNPRYAKALKQKN